MRSTGRISFVIGALLAMMALVIALSASCAQSCDYDMAEECLSQFDFCRENDEGWTMRSDPHSLCAHCVPILGLCINNTANCQSGEHADRYQEICREESKCDGCLAPALPTSPLGVVGGAPRAVENGSMGLIIRVGGSLLVAAVLLVVAGNFALK